MKDDNVIPLDKSKPLADVVELDIPTVADIPPDKILTAALGELDYVIVLGYDKEGKEYFCASKASGLDAVWLLERAKLELLRACDE